MVVIAEVLTDSVMSSNLINTLYWYLFFFFFLHTFWFITRFDFHDGTC